MMKSKYHHPQVDYPIAEKSSVVWEPLGSWRFYNAAALLLPSASRSDRHQGKQMGCKRACHPLLLEILTAILLSFAE